MTVFAAIRSLTFLARDVVEAALYLIPAPGLSGYDVDGADVLAEREARVEVSEPLCICDLGGYARNGFHQLGCPLWDADDHEPEPGCCEPQGDCGLGDIPDDIAHLYVEQPPVQVPDNIFEMGIRPRPSGTRQRPTEEQHLDNIWHRLGTLIEAVERQTTLLEDIRNLLQPNAPVASASPPTPADATAKTLANDPLSVHDRHMRRLLGEDSGSR